MAKVRRGQLYIQILRVVRFGGFSRMVMRICKWSWFCAKPMCLFVWITD